MALGAIRVYLSLLPPKPKLRTTKYHRATQNHHEHQSPLAR